MPQSPAGTTRSNTRPVREGQLTLSQIHIDTSFRQQPTGFRLTVMGEPFKVDNGDIWVLTDRGNFSLSALGVAPYGDGTWETERFATY